MKKKSFSKILSLILTVVFLMNTGIMLVSAEDTLNIQASTVNAAPGDSVQVQISLQNNPGIASLKMTVAYDDVLTLTNVEFDNAFSVAYATAPEPLSNPQTLSCISPMADITVNGVFATLTFVVAENAESGTFANVVINYNEDDIFNSNYDPVPVTITNGQVAVFLGTPGDVNGDNKVNNKDSIALFRFVAGWKEEVENLALDVNWDYRIDNKDSIDMFRYCSDWSMTPTPYAVFPAPWHSICSGNLEMIERVEPTCTAEGNIAYWHCLDCGKYYNSANAVSEITLSSTVLPALGHSWLTIPAVAPTATEYGSTEGKQCSLCGVYENEPEPIPPLGEDQYAITYFLYDNKEYLRSAGVYNPNPSVYSSSEGLILDSDENDQPYAAGYDFLGWYDAEGNRVTQIAQGETGAKILYARWDIHPYEIQFDSPLEPVPSTTYTVDKAKVLPSPKMDGYRFVGWSDIDGDILKQVSVGTTGDKVYSANWLSERNQAWTKQQVGDPVDITETGDQILFTYEIGEIRNVPVSVINDFGYINASGVTKEVTKTYTKTVNQTEMVNYSQTIAQATTESFGWTLSNGWNDQVSVDQEWREENQMDEEEVKSTCTTDNDNWYVSSGKSGYDTTTTYESANEYDLKTTTKNTKTYNTTNTQKRQDFSAELDLSYESKLGVNIDVISGEKKYGAELDLKYANGKTTDKKKGTEKDNGGGTETGKISHTGSDKVHNSSWNSSTGYGGSHTVTDTEELRVAHSKRISEATHYGESYILSGDETNTQGYVSNRSGTDEYSTGATFSTVEGTEYTETFTTANTVTGYHRWVLAGTAHVFAVVGYDIKTASYYAFNFTIMDDELYSFEDFSYASSHYDDNQTGVITFEVPSDIEEYVAERVEKSEGLEVSRDGRVTAYTGTDDLVLIPEYQVVEDYDGNPSVVKVTGLDTAAFRNNSLVVGVELSDYMTAIPAEAFENCSQLHWLSAKSLTSIGAHAFDGCPNMKVAAISENIADRKDNNGNVVTAGLGEQAFGDSIEELIAVVGDANIIQTILSSGAKTIDLTISPSCMNLTAMTLSVPASVESFTFNGLGQTFTDVCIVSNAESTTIIKANFISTQKIPVAIDSANVVLSEVSVSAPNTAVVFKHSQTNLALYGETTFTSSKRTMLTKGLVLSKVKAGLYTKLTVDGDIYVYATAEDIQPNGLLNFTGQISEISAEEFDKIAMGSFEIQFNVNGGIDLQEEETTKIAYTSEAVGSLPAPTRPYYHFDGWYTGALDGTLVTEDTILPGAENIVLFAHWTINPLSEWTPLESMPEDAQQVETKYSYNHRYYDEAETEEKDGWELYDTQRTAWGEEQGPVYSDPSNGERNVRSESYVSGYQKKKQYNYSRYWAKSGGVTHWGPWKASWSGVYCSNYEERGWGSQLTKFGSETAYNPNTEKSETFNKYGSSSNAWYNEKTRQVDDTSKPIYSTRWYYQEPIYTYYFYQDIYEEDDVMPVGDDYMNIQTLVRYRAK